MRFRFRPFLVATVTVVVAGVGYSRPREHNHVPKEGYVPDATTATAIATAVLVPVYGKETVEGESPFKVSLARDVWTVEGVPHLGSPGSFYIGGTALVRISKKTGTILRMTHGL